jgi:hypothetical protein
MEASTHPTELRRMFPDAALELDSARMAHEINQTLKLQGAVSKMEKSARCQIHLANGWFLEFRPMADGSEGFESWTGPVKMRDPEKGTSEIRWIYSVECILRETAHPKDVSLAFQVEASNVERLLKKSLYMIEKLGKKRLVPLPVENID